MIANAVNVRAPSRRLAIPLALCVVLVLGAALRLHGLTNQSLWTDELDSWRQSDQSSLADVLDRGVRPDVHPPGYQIFLYFVMEAFGDSEIALRLPSAIIGILTILAVYLLGVYIYTPKEGLLAAALMAALWAPLYYSQEARSYSMLLLLSILSSLAWFRMARDVQLESQLRWSSVALYVLVATVTCYVHYYGLLLIFLQGLYSVIAFARLRKALIRAGVAWGAILVLYTPWLPDLFADLSISETWIPKPTLLSLLSYAWFLFGRSLVLIVLAVEAVSLLTWTRIRAARFPKRRPLGQRLLDPTFILFMWLIVPVFAVFFKSLVSTSVFSERNLIICLPAAYLLLAHSLFVLPGSIRINPTLVSIGAILLTMGLAAEVIFRLDYYSGVHKRQYRETVQHVVNHSADYPNSVVIGCAWNPRHLEYYFEHFGSPRTVSGPVRTVEDVALLQSILQEEQPDYFWYVAAHRQPTEELLEFLSAEFSEISSTDFFGGEVWLYGVP